MAGIRQSANRKRSARAGRCKAAVAIGVASVLTSGSVALAEPMVFTGESADATYVAVATTGNANSSQGVAVSGAGTATGVVAASGAGTAYGPVSLSTTDTNDHAGGSASGAAEILLTECPLEPIPGPSCFAFWDIAHGAAFDAARTARAPGDLAVADANAILFQGAEADTEPVMWAVASVQYIVDQPNTLVDLIYMHAKSTAVSENSASAGARIEGPTGTMSPSALVQHCLTLECVSQLATNLPQAAGCLPSCAQNAGEPVLWTSVALDTYSMAGGDGEVSTAGMRWRNGVTRYHNMNDESGGPGIAYGRAQLDKWEQDRRYHEAWDFHGTTFLYSATPNRDRSCRVYQMTAVVDPTGSSELAGWAPPAIDLYGSAGSRGITAGFEAEVKPVKAGLSIGRSWNIPEGLAGGETTEKGGHRGFWQSGAKKGDLYTKSTEGVQSWKRPRGKAGDYKFVASGTFKGCPRQ